MADEEHHHEAIIIKRHGGGHEDGHHGGVWKIAFADFMTAMMAFFLVMWLISANDKTKATIASYFNPVKLVDTTTQPKGLEDAKAVESSAQPSKGAKNAAAKEAPTKEKPVAESQEAAKAGGEDATSTKGKEKRLAAALVDDPYAALTEIAGQKGAGEHTATPVPPAAAKKVAVNAISRKGGDAFRDPFAPPAPLQAETLASTEAGEVDAKPLPPGGGDPKIDTGAPRQGEHGGDSPVVALPEAPKAPPHTESTAQIADIKGQINDAVKGSGLEKGAPRIDVQKSDGGLLVSLTDTEDFEMFSSGSAVPSRKVVLMMDRIAQVLKARPGKIILRGFTDSRPYKVGRYDNWHLSLDRAQITHYMLVRGGFDEARIAHIEGYADRDLKSASAPTSPVNRRIEILIKDQTP